MAMLNHYLKDDLFFIKSIFDAIQEGVMILDQDFTIVQANRWMEDKYPFKMPLVGKKCYTLFKGGQDARKKFSYAECLETGKPYVEVLPYPSAQNPTDWYEISICQFKNTEDEAIGAIAHVKDVSMRKQAELLLKDEVTRWRTLVDQSRDGIVILDENGKVFEANQKFSNMLGYSLEEINQLHVWDWEAWASKKQVLEMLKTVDDNGDHFETCHRRKNGTLYDVSISTNGAVYRGQKLVFCVCRDITDRKQAEKEREKIIGELQDALAEIKTLRGILPLCSFCKKVRDDKGYWERIDVYIHKHSQADISHSICPACMKKHYPGIEDDI